MHPTEAADGCPAGTHQFPFFCDDLRQTVDELKGRGVEFAEEISESSWGFVTRLKIPGGCEVQLYQPRYSTGTGR